MATAVTSITDQAITETISRMLARYPQHAARIERGATLLRIGAVRKLAEGRYSVRSVNGGGAYTVTQDEDETITCPCPDATNRHRACKHSWAVFAFNVSATRFAVLSERAARAVPSPEQWAPEDAKRLMFARWRLNPTGRLAYRVVAS